MPWRLHVTNRAIQRLDVLNDTNQSLLVVWTQPGRVSYVDLESGMMLGEKRLPDLANRTSQHWQTLLPDVPAPNDAYPPVLAGQGVLVFLTPGQDQRLYHYPRSGELYLVSSSSETRLGQEHRYRAVDLARETGMIAAVDLAGRLHVFHHATPAGVHELGLNPSATETITAVAIAKRNFFVAAGRTLLRVDADGRVQKRLQLHYALGAFACSPAGDLLVCSDRDTNVIRVYDSTSLSPLHQRHAVDLVARATQVQLIADLPPVMVVLNNLSIGDNGLLAFALGGVVCATDITQMLAIPRPVT
ncbi:MAG: hypothetical protein CL610_28080 [Anaerolineaceae bacterium]|nr:hypothetical protein [Anaerolineaceae bacterium]